MRTDMAGVQKVGYKTRQTDRQRLLQITQSLIVHGKDFSMYLQSTRKPLSGLWPVICLDSIHVLEWSLSPGRRMDYKKVSRDC